MTPSEPPEPTPSAVDRCLSCGEGLAHDQRYCVHCGTRRGSLPTPIAASLREMSGRGDDPVLGADPGEAEAGDPGRRRPVEILPLARAAAVSILLMLGVGAVFGASLRPGGVASLAREVVLVVHHPAPAPTTVASAPSPAPSSSSGGTDSRGGGASPGPAASGGSGNSSGTGGSSGSGAGSGSSSGSGSGSGSGNGSGSGQGTGPEPATTLPPIGHVWEIVLSGQGYSQSFGTSAGHPYLSNTLADQGELVTQYDAVASSPLANEVALISGQGPTQQTIADCPTYSDITPGTTGKLGQVLGSGCLYPSSTETLGQQLQIDGLKWRAYIQGIGASGQPQPGGTTSGTTTSTTTPTPPTTPTTASTTTDTTSSTTTSSSTSSSAPLADTSTAAGCPHPAQDASDATQAATGKGGYVTWKNPWVYFHSTVDDHAACAKDDVGLTRLAKDLREDSTTPAFSYIAPDPCDDGSDTPCRPGAKGGLARADSFLHKVVPEIERSTAYKTDGLILITFDEAPQSGPDWSTASCCGQPSFPNLTAPTTTSTTATTPTTTSTVPTTTTTTTTTAPSTTTSTTTASTTTDTRTPPADCPTTTTTATTPTTPTTPTTTTSTTTTPSDCTPEIAGDPAGGGQVGLLMISPYVKPHTVNTIETYNHFSLLKSVEALFGVPHLGYTADKQVPAFIPSLFLAQKR
jgi:phosphatidylinositol-3-phosphatase